MPPKKEKHKKVLFSFLNLNKNKKKEKDDLGINNLSEETVNNIGSDKLEETSILKAPEPIPDKSNVIFLIGWTGKGKSTLANVLINKDNSFEEIFKESGASVSGTKEIQKEEFTVSDNNTDINYAVIDTVGIGDTKLSKEEVLDKIAEAVYLARDGVSQVFFVISKKFDQKEMANYDLLRTIIFDNKIVNYTTIIRTHFKDFEDEKKHQADVDSMINEGGKLAEIIKSCQKKVVHVNNPSLNLVPSDVADNERENEEKKINEKIKDRKKIRSVSREVLLKHLEQVCQENPYLPPKLRKLSTEIADYMEQKINKRKELEEKRTKLGLREEKKPEDIKMINNFYQVEQNRVTSNIEQQGGRSINESEKNKDSETFSIENNGRVGESVFGEEDKKEQASNNNQGFKNNQANFKEIKERIKWRIVKLQEELKELEEAKKLKEEIKEKEEAIRREVLKHIFNNHNEITQATGGSTFINSIFGDNIDLSKVKKNKDYNFNELLSQLKELKKDSEDKEDLMILSLKEIETETKKREEKLVELKKMLLNDKEIFKEWQNQGFSIQQANEWANALKNSFDPKTDSSFCAWLMDNKKLRVEEVLKESIEQLRKEYAEQLKKADILNEHKQELNHEKEENWTEIHPDFNEELQKKWENNYFNYEECQEWINLGLQPTEADYACWLRDIKYDCRGYNSDAIEEHQKWLTTPNHPDQELRTEYQQSEYKQWGDLHPGFAGPSGSYYQNNWKKQGFSPLIVKSWIEVGLEPRDDELVDYARWKNYQPSQISKKGLDQEYEKWKKNLQTQEYLNFNYPREKRGTITELSVIWKGLEGNLNLNGFIGLKKLDCSFNKLTSLDLANCEQLTELVCSNNHLTNLSLPNYCPNLVELRCSENYLTKLNFLSVLNPEKLKKLDIRDNNFSNSNLSIFASFPNLEGLWIGNWGDEEKIKQNIYNRFAGSVEPLTKLEKLKYLDIRNINLDQGVEYLPESLRDVDWPNDEKISYSTNQRLYSKVKETKSQLDLFTANKKEFQIHQEIPPKS